MRQYEDKVEGAEGVEEGERGPAICQCPASFQTLPYKGNGLDGPTISRDLSGVDKNNIVEVRHGSVSITNLTFVTNTLFK